MQYKNNLCDGLLNVYITKHTRHKDEIKHAQQVDVAT
jgi:hypothetical protein